MVIFASFNGGPSDHAVLLAFIASSITGPIVGGIARRPLIGFAVGTLCGLVISGVVLVRGNQPGDGASFFLVCALIFFCPVCGLLSGGGAAVAGWIMGKLLAPRQRGASGASESAALAEVFCRACGTRMAVRETEVNLGVKCPKCGEYMEVQRSAPT
jgi:predicted RNA-binding Zn-ribbon protein involved in translation (DUF1610 family)